MKIESLYEYIVLAHYLNFTTAASNLHTSQPNLSKHISELEQELGVTLLRREKRLELTAAGTAFLEDAIQIHHLYKDATKRCREIDAYAVEELVIQEPYLMDAMSEILFKSVMRFRRSDPHVMTKYYSEKGKKSVELLEAGKVDIALTVDCNSIDWITKVSEKKNLIFFPVIREPLHVWLWERHPLASKQSITLEDLLQVPINMTATPCSWCRQPWPPLPCCRCSTTWWPYRWMTSGRASRRTSSFERTTRRSPSTISWTRWREWSKRTWREARRPCIWGPSMAPRWRVLANLARRSERGGA